MSTKSILMTVLTGNIFVRDESFIIRWGGGIGRIHFHLNHKDFCDHEVSPDIHRKIKDRNVTSSKSHNIEYDVKKKKRKKRQNIYSEIISNVNE